MIFRGMKLSPQHRMIWTCSSFSREPPASAFLTARARRRLAAKRLLLVAFGKLRPGQTFLEAILEILLAARARNLVLDRIDLGGLRTFFEFLVLLLAVLLDDDALVADVDR